MLFRKKKVKEERTFVIDQGQNNSNVLSVLAQQKFGVAWAFTRTYITLYQQVTPLSNAIDIIAETASAIPLRLEDTKNKKYITDHPILDLMNNPNELPNSNYCSFISEISKFYSIVGNNFFIITFSSSGEPLEIFVIPPQYVNWYSGSDGYIARYEYMPRNGSETFTRDLQFRYFNEDKTRQLLHLRDFNPDSYSMYLYGLSKLNSILAELFQYQAASTHNLSLLKNGARVGSVFILKDDTVFNDEDMQYLQSQIENMYSGDSNAARSIMSTMIKDVKNMLQSNVDMDFATMKTKVTESIYNRLNVPLALVNSTALSLANMETAKVNLYSFAVLPQLKTIFAFLTNNIMPYYKGSENLKLNYDPFTIDTLRIQAIAEAVQLKQLDVLSDNELRNKIDMNPYDEGSNVYKPSTDIPVEVITADGD